MAQNVKKSPKSKSEPKGNVERKRITGSGERKEIKEEFEDITFSPGWIIISTFLFVDEIFDVISIFLDFTGVWLIISYVVSIIPLLLFLGWRIVEEGFSFSAIFGSGKQILFLVLEFIPGVEDVWPGWILTMSNLRKKKVVKSS